jgi:hypothetical protein
MKKYFFVALVILGSLIECSAGFQTYEQVPLVIGFAEKNYYFKDADNPYKKTRNRLIERDDAYKQWVYLSEKNYVEMIHQRYKDKSGYIKIGDQSFYIYSYGAYNSSSSVWYVNNELSVDFVDLNNDGVRDLIISGAVSYKHRREMDALDLEDVVFIYLCDMEKKSFVPIFKKASFDVEQEGGCENGSPPSYFLNIIQH